MNEAERKAFEKGPDPRGAPNKVKRRRLALVLRWEGGLGRMRAAVKEPGRRSPLLLGPLGRGPLIQHQHGRAAWRRGGGQGSGRLRMGILRPNKSEGACRLQAPPHGPQLMTPRGRNCGRGRSRSFTPYSSVESLAFPHPIIAATEGRGECEEAEGQVGLQALHLRKPSSH